MSLALEGVKVLDLASMWAVPTAGVYLADQGAEVIKIEPPWGDEARRVLTAAPIGDENRHFLAVNRNKRGIVVNIATPEGQEIVHRLVCWADVLLQNFRPGVAERLRLDYETTRQLNPRLIYVTCTPYGPKGPYAHWRAYDLLVQAHTGLLSLRRTPEGMPITSGVWIADCSTPILIAYAVALALLVRERTGRGQKVETALLYGALAMQFVDLVRAESETTPPQSFAAQAMYAPYRCADGQYIMLVAVADEEWVRLCRAMDVEHLAADARFASHHQRAQRSDELYPVLEALFATKTRDEWLEIFAQHDIPCAPIITREEVFRHPQIVENDMIMEVEHPKVGRVKMTGIPIRLSENPGRVRRPAPGFGEHTEEVLLELGYTREGMAELRRQRVVI